jgi:retron-type reverse transcriptase
MKITNEQKEAIKDNFQKMETKNDFLHLLNQANTYLFPKKPILFSLGQLNNYINKERDTVQTPLNKEFSSHRSYQTFQIKKKSGGFRTLHAPVDALKGLQTALNLILQCVYEPHQAATGFVMGKSIVDNAKIHVNKNYVYNLDLKDFFPSVDQARIWGRIKAAPFHLGTTEGRKKIANMIAALTCTKMEVERFVDGTWQKTQKRVLPQGAPTSPVLTNAVCEKLDVCLSGVAKRFGLNYSRYADDITFSSQHNVFELKRGVSERIYEVNSTFDLEVRRIIHEQNFHVKESKVRLQKQGFRQEVTGIVVNEKLNVNQRYVKQLRQWLFNWETYGYEKAYTKFLNVYAKDRGNVKSAKPNMVLVLAGKLLYLKMVKGELDPTYMKLKARFDQLNPKSVFIDKVLDIWEKEGIEQAMDFYYDYQKKNTWGLTPMSELLEKLNAGLVLTIENQSIENDLLITKTSAINVKNIDGYIYDQEMIALVSENLTENDYN